MRFWLLAVAALIAPTVAPAQVRVQGYTKKDGTYVAPHYRSNPDGNASNNWSTRGNTNPYTGAVGTKDPYRSGSSSWGSSSSSSSSSSGSNASRSGSCYAFSPC